MKKTYHIITIGCQMNEADSERIASYLEFYGFKKAEKRQDAGVVVLNTCGIRQKAEDRNYGLIPVIKKENKNTIVILAGCLSERKDVIERLKEKVDIWLPIKELPTLHKKLGLKKKSFTKKDYLNIEPKTVSKFSVFIPIGNGCNNFCAYCVVPYARGREEYRPAYEIIKEVAIFVGKKFKEITLIAQNVNSYKAVVTKADIKYFPDKKIGDIISFPELFLVVGHLPELIPLKKGVGLPKNYWVRFATSHPKDMSDELIRVVASGGRFAPYIHLPVQAGDDKILTAMNRKYTSSHYLSLIEKIKKAIPDVGLSTDVIVGFPGETKKQFNNSAKLMKKVAYDMAYLAQFSPRPGTAAYKMKDNVSKEEKARREAELESILRQTSLDNGKKFVEREVVVLVEDKTGNGKWYGKNGQNRTVAFSAPANLDLCGKFVLVKVKKAKSFALEGEFVR
jgi:tRNA-2-methylthio-N6-dimethylallyladenosine synthase